MSSIEQYTYWNVTINNPDDNDMLIVRNPNDKYVRHWIWTPEQGKEGTPHIQGWLRLHRNQTITMVKKLYPRAHLKPIRKDEYNENSQQYAQKDDETTRGKHNIHLNDPLPDVMNVIYRVYEPIVPDYGYPGMFGWFRRYEDLPLHDLRRLRLKRQEQLVEEDYKLAKYFVSATYEKMLEKYERAIYKNLCIKYTNALSKENHETTPTNSVEESKARCSESSGKEEKAE